MFLALRELRQAKLRYALIGMIMILIAWLTFMVTGLVNGLASDNASAIQNMKAHSFILQKEANQKLGQSVLTPKVLKDIQDQVGETNATPLSETTISLQEEGTTDKMDITVFGIDPTSFVAPAVKQGQSLHTDELNEAVVSEGLKANGVKIGDVLKNDDVNQSFKVIGFTNKSMFSHTPVIYVNMKQFQALQHAMGKANASYQAIVLQGNMESLGKSVVDVQLFTKDEMVQSIPGFKEEQGSLTMMTIFLVVIAAFVQAGFFYVLTLQKTSQFGVLKAIGTTTFYLTKSVIGQVLILAASAIIIGLGLTYGVSALLPDSMPFVLSNNTILQYTAILLMVSMLGASLSLLQITRIDAIEAIGRAEA
ncbi:ABC transporter permease [Bacillus sp. OTU530]|uniref:ABC transporter permease n=1 Tax=Bacillus sp. OTU530 TaxID=3043862 RepID=UPI00313C2B6B